MPRKTNQLSEWAVVLPNEMPAIVREALLTLRKLNKSLTGADADLFEVVEETDRWADILLQNVSPHDVEEGLWISKADEFLCSQEVIVPPLWLARYKPHAWDGRFRTALLILERQIEDVDEAKGIEEAAKEVRPFKFFPYPRSRFYLFGKYLWQITKSEATLDSDDLALIFLETCNKEKRKLSRLRNKYHENNFIHREPIPEEVRVFVWRRDQGKCVSCGSNQNLEFDHIIPVSKGGANTSRNIQLLCESCNRAKGCEV
jgi:5-methylcytosine-specific restriction endonuclease McrA